jgi:hypothetical protein
MTSQPNLMEPRILLLLISLPELISICALRICYKDFNVYDYKKFA